MDKLLQLKNAVKEAVAPDPLSHFKLSETVRQGGHQRLLRMVDAVERTSGDLVTVFLWVVPHALDRCGGNQELYHHVLNKVRDGVQALTRLRHPNVLRVQSPWTEDKARNRFVFATERISRWADAEVPQTSSPPSTSNDNGKYIANIHGLLQVGRALEFLHTKVGMMLLHFSPSSIAVAPSGDWKIGDLTHCVVIASGSPTGASLLSPIPDKTLFRSIAAPRLDFCAPEVVAAWESVAANEQKKQAGKQPNVADLFDFSSSSTAAVGPQLPDSDCFSFMLTVIAVVDGRPLIHTGGEIQVYHRQVAEATSTLRQRFPQWSTSNGSPRPTMGHILQTECFASREVQLLVQLPTMPSMEPKAKLTVLKGFHDEIARGAFAAQLLKQWVVGPLIRETEDERMIKYIIPVLLEAAACLDRASFDESLRTFLVAMLQRASSENRQDYIAESLLAQFLDKFSRFWKHVSGPKDVQGLLGPLLGSGLSHSSPSLVAEALAATDMLLHGSERPFPDGNKIAAHVLSAVMITPTSTPVVLRCLNKLLPCTTREGRESELEPKIVAGLNQLCRNDASVSAADVERLLQVLMSIIKESSVEHVATVTLPLLCPLLIIRHVVVRQHISKYVNELVQLVIRKREAEEQQEEQQKQRLVATINSSATTSSMRQATAVPPPPLTEASTSFFHAAPPAGHRTHTDPITRPLTRDATDDLFGEMKSTPVAVPPRDDVRDVFGF